MNEVVKYHNDVNKIPLGNLTEKELNIFFSLIFKAKEKGTQKIELTFSELRTLSNGDTHNPRFIKAIQSMEDKLIKLSQRVEVEEGKFEVFTLFNRFSLDTKGKTLKIQVNDMFYYMLNDLLKEFTEFDLVELVNCRSSYSKNIFRLLKQWNSVGKLELKMEEFKSVLCVPKSYRMRDIDMRVLIPIMQELRPVFNNLRLEKIKNGRTIQKFLFTWDKIGKIEYKSNEEILEAVKLEISEGLYKAIEKIEKNRFLQPFMTTQNIKKLLEIFTDKQLTKGLYLADKKINKKIDTLVYIIKTIKTELEKKEIKIVIKKEEPKDLQGVEPKAEKLKELTEEIKTLENVDFGKLFLKTSNQLIKTGRYEKLKGKFETIKEIGALKEFIKVNNLEAKKI